MNSELKSEYYFSKNALNEHRKSLNMPRSISMGGIIKSSKRLSLQQQTNNSMNFNLGNLSNMYSYDEEVLTNNLNSNGTELSDETAHEQFVASLEKKIAELNDQNESLKLEINEYINKLKNQNIESDNLLER
jgi:hypothetical protein